MRSQDKTGTITQGKMTATHVYSQGAMCSVTGKGYSVDGTVLRDGQDIMGLPAAAAGGVFATFLLGGVLCNNTSLEDDPETGKPVVHGSATEAPLVVGAAKLQLDRDSNVEAAYPRYDEVRDRNNGSGQRAAVNAGCVAVRQSHFAHPALLALHQFFVHVLF